MAVESDALALARRYVDIDRPQAALDALGRAREDELETAEYWAIRAQSLLQLERSTASAEAAQRGLERSPQDVQLLDLLALAHLQSGHCQEASDVLSRALEIAPADPILLAHRALAVARLGAFDSARALVAEAMRLAPDFVPVLRVRAQVAFLARDESASDYIDELLEREPEDATGHALRGNLAIRGKQYVSASKAFDEAVRLDPSDSEFAEVAGKARVAAHPLLAPVRPIWRFGRWRSYFVFLTLVFVLAASGLKSLRVVVVAAWLCIAFLSWFGPPLIRWRRRRKYGDV